MSGPDHEDWSHHAASLACNLLGIGPAQMHKNARLTPLRRKGMARSALARKMSRPEAAVWLGATAKTVVVWLGRFFWRPGPAPRRVALRHVAERAVATRCPPLEAAASLVSSGHPSIKPGMSDLLTGNALRSVPSSCSLHSACGRPLGNMPLARSISLVMLLAWRSMTRMILPNTSE